MLPGRWPPTSASPSTRIPGCPWAYSAEPFRRRLTWLYGDQLEWRVTPRRAGRRPAASTSKKGFTPEKQARAFALDRARPRHADRHARCARAWRRRSPPAAPWWPRACTRRRPSARCCAACACATSRASCSTSPRRSTAPRATRASTPPTSSAGWPSADVARGAARGHGARPAQPMPAARVLDAQARQLVGRAALHVPVLRDRAHRPTACASRCPASSPSRSTTSCIANLVPGRRPPRAPDDVGRGPALGRHAAGLQGGRGGVRHLACRTRARRSAASPTSSTSASTASGASTELARPPRRAARWPSRAARRTGRAPARAAATARGCR